MEKLHFSIIINAPREKVWDTMLEDVTYRQWTAPFNPVGSFYRGSWDQGAKMLFLGGGQEEGKESGMVSRIKENRLHEFLSIEHLGLVTNGVEDTTSEEAKKWAPAYENYTFADVDGGTEVTVDVDSDEGEFKAMFEEAWPKALQKLKELAEE